MIQVRRLFTKHAFTLMELMVVVIIVGIIAAFAIPSYRKAVDRAYEKEGILNLRLMTAAQEVYKAKNGRYYPGDGLGNRGLAEVNANLGLNIVPHGTDNYISSGDATSYTVYAWHRDEAGNFKWCLTFQSSYIGNVGIESTGGCCHASYFAANPCPTVPICP